MVTVPLREALPKGPYFWVPVLAPSPRPCRCRAVHTLLLLALVRPKTLLIPLQIVPLSKHPQVNQDEMYAAETLISMVCGTSVEVMTHLCPHLVYLFLVDQWTITISLPHRGDGGDCDTLPLRKVRLTEVNLIYDGYQTSLEQSKLHNAALTGGALWFSGRILTCHNAALMPHFWLFPRRSHRPGIAALWPSGCQRGPSQCHGRHC